MEDLAGPQVMERWIGPAEGWLILCRHNQSRSVMLKLVLPLTENISHQLILAAELLLVSVKYRSKDDSTV